MRQPPSPHLTAPDESTGGRMVVAALEQAGVRRAFGVPGESFMGVLDALFDSEIEFVSTRHEGGAAFMASGYSKVSGEIGVCMGTRAVGAANLSIGIHTARQDSTPMLALVGQVRRGFREREAFQEIDLARVYGPMCKWAVEIDDAGRAGELMQTAIRVARTGRPGPVLVALPEDMLADRVAAPLPAARVMLPAAPSPAAVETMLDLLVRSRRPLLLAGGEVASSGAARDLLRRVAEAFEVPVLGTWRRHDVLPNDHRLFVGSASLGQPACVWDTLAGADAVLAIGTRLQEITTRGYSLPGEGCRTVLVHPDSEVVARVHGVEVGVVSDVALALGALLESSVRPAAADLGERAAANRALRTTYEATSRVERTGEDDSDVSPAHVVAAIDELAAADAILTTDAGNFYGWVSRHYRFRSGRSYVGPTSGAMGYAVPAAVGAKLAAPARQVIAVAGDGGVYMTLGEIETAVRCDAPICVVVIDNGRYGTIRMHQEREHPGRVVGTDLGQTDLAGVAEGMGAEAIRVNRVSHLREALRQALGGGRPALVHVPVSPDYESVSSAAAGPTADP